ncbi:MAG: NYN domain-containing protein [Thermoanaerobaculia bacterium]|nr:NYN domain-containing protein [Thermoanaerobaculia bacterium]
MSANNHRRLAVLIDADNVQAAIAKRLLEEISKHGTATVKRVYGDWTSTNLKGWKEHLHTHAIQPIQQFSYTNGKNATDSALIIDAMDLLYSGKVNGFCLVSSDSDLTRLATRLREAGMVVLGFGRQATPVAFVSACDQFTFIDTMCEKTANKSVSEPKVSSTVSSALAKLLTKAIQETQREDGWALLTQVGDHLRKLQPGFSTKTHGHATLGKLVKAQNYLSVKENTGHWTIKLKGS